MRQHYRTRPALTLTPALSRSNHLATVEIDVEAAVAECACHLTQ